MAEIVSVAIDAIVTGEAVVAECEKMGLGEGNIHLAVAGLAGVWGES